MKRFILLTSLLGIFILAGCDKKVDNITSSTTSVSSATTVEGSTTTEETPVTTTTVAEDTSISEETTSSETSSSTTTSNVSIPDYDDGNTWAGTLF